MPNRPNTPCQHPGCPELVPYGTKYCERHKPMHPEESRSASVRGYNHRWQQVRKKYLQSHPLCVECLKAGRYTAATDVDHIVPHRGYQKLFWDSSNWQALCHQCHSRKTANEDGNPKYEY